MRVPDAKNQAALRFSTPPTNDSYYTRPSGCLKDSREALNHDEVQHRVDVFGLCIAEGVAEESREQHAQSKKVAEGNALGNHSGKEHGNCVTEQKARIEESQHSRRISSV